jgi:hypothetical protein
VFHSLIGNLLSRQQAAPSLMWHVGKSGGVKVDLRSQPGLTALRWPKTATTMRRPAASR